MPITDRWNSTQLKASPLRGARACVFDAYGTLFDFASAARQCREMLGDDIDRLTALWRDKQLQYTWLRAAQGRHADFWQVTGDALDFALETLNLSLPGLRDRLMGFYLTLDLFSEVPDVLRRLKAAGLKTAILSNGSPAMLDAAVKAAKLEALLDEVFSVESVGCVQAPPQSLSTRRRSARYSSLSYFVPVVERLGRLRGIGVWHASRLVQSLWPTARASAGISGPGDQVFGGTPGLGRGLNTCRA